MVKNMKTYNYTDIQKKIESIFTKLKFEFSLLDFEDDDLNYSVQIQTIGKLKPLNYIDALIYFSNIDCSINFIVTNIYKLKDDSNLLSLYEIINSINNELSSGKFSIYGNANKQIIYRCSSSCGDNFNNLTEETIIYPLLLFINMLEMLLEKLKELK